MKKTLAHPRRLGYPPFMPVSFDAILAVITGLIALWTALLHRKVTNLANNNTGTNNKPTR
jgi:hypothetical protein